MNTELISLITGVVVAFLGALAGWFVKGYLPAHQKEQSVSSASIREQINSARSYNEAKDKTSQTHQDAQETKLVDFLLTQSDGKITAIHTEISDLKTDLLNKINDLEIKIERRLTDIDNRDSEQGRLMIASQNQLVTSIVRFTEGLPVLLGVKDYGSSLGIQAASIKSAAVQESGRVAAAASATEEAVVVSLPLHLATPPGVEPPIEGVTNVIAIVKAEPSEGEK